MENNSIRSDNGVDPSSWRVRGQRDQQPLMGFFHWHAHHAAHSHFHIASCATPGPRWTVSRLNMLATQAFQYVVTLNVFRSKFPFLSCHSDVHLHWLALGTKTTCLGWLLWLSWSRMETVWLPVEKSPQTQLRMPAGVIKNVQCYNCVGCNDVTTIHSSSSWCGMWLIII